MGWPGGAWLVALLAGLATPAFSQEPAAAAEKADPWATLRLLEGSWEGAVDGSIGAGRARRRYELLFDGLYLMHRHASVRLPQEKSPRGDYHRELAVYSYDRERELIVLREFMGEGFVNRYVCNVEPRRFVCVSEDMESGPGMRGRLTVEITDRYRFEERFELAGAGQEPQPLLTIQWTRTPDLAD